MKPATRRMLDAIDKFLVDGRNVKSGASSELWDVLAALRGPDSYAEISKKGRTIPIRIAALPRCAARVKRLYPKGEYATGALPRCAARVKRLYPKGEYATGATFSLYGDDTPIGAHAYDERQHFLSHTRVAFDVLGLKNTETV
jgi:hypothetical protein